MKKTTLLFLLAIFSTFTALAQFTFPAQGPFTVVSGTPSIATVVEDCLNGEFSVDVDITSFGDATSVFVENGATSVQVTTLWVFTSGLFPIETPVNIQLLHPSANASRNVSVNDDCPTIIQNSVDCASATPVNTTYCYDNNEDIQWVFTSNDGSALRVSFIEGYFEDVFNDIIIYDGASISDPVLFMSDTNFNNDAIGISALSTGDTILVRLVSDTSVSCASRSDSALNFNVGCEASLSTTDFDIQSSFTYYPNPVKNSLTRIMQ